MLASLGASILWLGSSLHANPPGWGLYYRIRAYDATLSSALGRVQCIVRAYRSGRANILSVAMKQLRAILVAWKFAEIAAGCLFYVVVSIEFACNLAIVCNAALHNDT